MAHHMVGEGSAAHAGETRKNTDADIVLHIRGAEPTIEYTLRSLMWLRENGTLRSDISINARSIDDETRSVLRRFAAQYRCISFTEE